MDTQLLYFGLVVVALAGQLGDCYTTEVSLAHGMVEGNPIAAWLQKKIGQTGLTILKCAGAAITLPMLTTIFAGITYGCVVAGIIGGIGVFATVKNYLLMRKNHIPLGL
jgi:hypothetical protein